MRNLERIACNICVVILDAKRGTLFIARDRVGKKPLKFFLNGEVFAFASELKALRTLKECPAEIDWQAVHHFLTMMYVPAPSTGIKGVEKLPAAHCMRVDLKSGKIDVWRYWSLRYDNEAKSFEQWKGLVMDKLDESVRLRMIADVPVGAFLSGGVDSAAVTALMAKHSSKPIETFSIGSPEETHNELPDAGRIAKKFNTNHHPIVLKPDVTQLLPELVRAYEEPFADPSVIPTYLLAREARKSVTVALNGDGGDENFAGYVRYPILKFSRYWSSQFTPIHAATQGLTGAFHRLANNTLSYRMHRFQSSIRLFWPQRYLQYLSFFTEEEKRGLYKDGVGKDFDRTDILYALKTAQSRTRSDDVIHQAMSMDIDTYLADDLLPKVDLGSMASGLEARSPLLDHELLELTARMPSSLKLRGFSRKHVFKKMLRGLVPDETLNRKKTGFRLPLDRWFRGDCKSFVEDRLLRGDSKLWTLMDRAKVEGFLKRYYDSKVDYSDHVWALLWLDEWLGQFGE